MALRQVMENTQVPLIINNHLKNWKIMNYTEQDWCKLFGPSDLLFRSGDFQFATGPQWEGTCRRESMTLKQFFDRCKKFLDVWYYYDYKDMTTAFSRNGEIFDAFDWADLGFPDIPSQDSTLWIGSSGAHTPCHMDAHGFNLVAQIYGRKLWVLISPKEMDKLEPTRVPYEETTIYSGVNFFTPVAKFSKLSNVYKIILEPGQVLCVPRHWWHYVENLEPAISINTWIPCEEDIESQLDEALVQKFVHSFSRDIDEKFISLGESVEDHVLEHLAEKCHEYRSKEKIKTDVNDKLTEVSHIEVMSPDDLMKFVQDKSTKYGYNYSKDEFLPASTSKKIINAFCHPENVKTVREVFLKQQNRKEIVPDL